MGKDQNIYFVSDLHQMSGKLFALKQKKQIDF